MTPTQRDLQDAYCWFDSDKAGGQQMTDFKREARWRQHRWAVDELSITDFGTHTGRRTHPDAPAEEIDNGTKLREADAAVGSNFLTPEIFEVAKDRLKNQQQHETLESKRLMRDLLSSMPMAFNLFAEASLPAHAIAREQLARRFNLEVELGAPSDIVFEWSPGRRDPMYTGDRTAFDVALRFGAQWAPRTVVGIETKYHEHSTKEKKPGPSNPGALRRYEEQTDFLMSLAENSGVFAPGWQDKVLATDLRQIWRDHLLALSMRQHPAEWTRQTRYVLLYPSRNVSFHHAATAYQELLVDRDESFQAVTIEAILDDAFAHGGPTKDAFARRYLW